MLKLLNFSVDPWDLDKFDNDAGKIGNFLSRHGIAGFEMIQYADWDDCIVPKSLLIGAHACFWPSWLDFWREDKASLLRQFGSEEACRQYYGFSGKDELRAYYKRELAKAGAAGVRYVVFHVSHVEMEHTYTYRFTYDDHQVADAFIDMMNEIVGDEVYDFDIVFENHWYPGLTLLDSQIAERLMKEIHHPRKGFVLDIGHMMNANLELETETQAVDYIMENVRRLGDMAGRIKVIHLNSSLTGDYVKRTIAGKPGYDPNLDFDERHVRLYEHVSRIDTHQPFADPSIRRVIDYLSPDYLVYEFSVETLEELERHVTLQNGVIGL